jgi:hypothetical protein
MARAAPSVLPAGPQRDRFGLFHPASERNCAAVGAFVHRPERVSHSVGVVGVEDMQVAVQAAVLKAISERGGLYPLDVILAVPGSDVRDVASAVEALATGGFIKLDRPASPDHGGTIDAAQLTIAGQARLDGPGVAR